jgi:hypothetical protein
VLLGTLLRGAWWSAAEKCTTCLAPGTWALHGVSCPMRFLSEWGSSGQKLCLDPRVGADDGGICGCRFPS